MLSKPVLLELSADDAGTLAGAVSLRVSDLQNTRSKLEAALADPPEERVGAVTPEMLDDVLDDLRVLHGILLRLDYA